MQTSGQKRRPKHRAGVSERGSHRLVVRRHFHAAQSEANAQHDMFRRVSHRHAAARFANAQFEDTQRTAACSGPTSRLRVRYTLDFSFNLFRLIY